MSRTNPNFRFSCPNPYTLDPTLGVCVEPTPVGFKYVNGRFVRQCPPGMTMNDLGVCIRPVMTRTSFVNESNIHQTTLVLAGQKKFGGPSLTFGTYDPAAYDTNFVQYGLDSASVNQVKLSDGSQTLFLVAQSGGAVSGAAPPKTAVLSGVVAATASGTSSLTIAPTFYTTDGQDESPDSSVFKLEYSNSGYMYMLGNPRNKIFKAAYSASLYATGATSKPIFNFQQNAYSVESLTEPYYVGSYPTLGFDPSGNLAVTTLGALQSGLDVDTHAQAPVSDSFKNVQSHNQNQDEPTRHLDDGPTGPTGPTGPGPNQTCVEEAYDPLRPADPVPQILQSVSDATSRNFYLSTLQTSSKGFVIAGTGIEVLDPNLLGQALAVRYRIQDECIAQNKRPFIQSLSRINLNVAANDGDIRIARFDTLDNDTLYVFGSDGASTNGISDTVLSFITESHIYNGQNLSFGAYINTVQRPLVAADIFQVNFTSIDSYTAAVAFAEAVSLQLSTASVNVQIVVDLVKFTQTGKFVFAFADAPYVRPTQQVFLQFLSGVPNTPDMSVVAQALGFVVNTVYQTTSGVPYIEAPLVPNMGTVVATTAFNGFAWDDQAEYGVGLNRPDVSAMPIAGITGPGIQAWCYDPVGQALAIAVGTATNSTRSIVLSAEYTQETYLYDQSDSFVVPADCIDIEVKLWGAGGSCSPNVVKAAGGAGAFVGGHLKTALWNPGDTLQVLVGSGGGSGNAHGVGSGGGRTSILNKRQELVTAGGGGGSVGNSYGGAASASGAAQSGWPKSNGGLGATTNSSGRGGTIFGDRRFKKATDGAKFMGGDSMWANSKGAIGGGGGGAGYYGGGSGGYLGIVESLDDTPAAGGGGSSYLDNLLAHVAISGTAVAGAPNSQLAPYTQSSYYIAHASELTADQPKIAQGGTAKTKGQGGPGYAVIILTRAASGVRTRPVTSVSPTIWASRANQFDTFTLYGTVSASGPVAPDWSSIFQRLTIPGVDFQEVSAIFTGLNGLVVAVINSGFLVQPPADENWAIFDPAEAACYVYWTYITSGTGPFVMRMASPLAFGPIALETILPPLSNVTSIRLLPSGDLAFIGDGIRVLTPPATNSDVWQNQRYVLDHEGNPLDNMTIVDGSYNEQKGILEVTGKPKTFQVTSVHKTPWCPTFANFYDVADVTLEVTPYYPWLSGQGLPPEKSRFGVPTKPLYNFDLLVEPAPPLPNTVFLIRKGLQAWNVVSFYEASAASNGTIDIVQLKTTLETELNALLAQMYPGSTVEAAVAIGPFNILAITITNLPSNDDIQISFTTQNLQNFTYADYFSAPVGAQVDVDKALASAAALLGFKPSLIDSTNVANVTQSGTTYEASFQATSSVALVPTSTESTSKTLTPISVPLSVNSVYAGSLYHVYAPQVRFATHQGLVVAIGGPITSPLDSTNNAPSSLPDSLHQSIQGPGSEYYIDFNCNNGQKGNPSEGSSYWGLYDFNGALQPLSVINQSPIRSPANILVSDDSGTSYQHVESLLGAYLEFLNVSTPGAVPLSTFAITALDCFHLAGTAMQMIGPAKIQRQGSNGHVNAAVSQFNDIKWIPAVGASGSTQFHGYFIAVGQFLWELNSMFDARITWPADYTDLCGVVWVSLDGFLWTTLPIKEDTPASQNKELFWMLYKVEYIDPIQNIGAFLTDVGLYKFDTQVLMSTIISLFTEKPCLDFSGLCTVFLQATAIGRTGPFAAVCTSRDPTGTCIKCEGNAIPVSIPQIIGPGGVIQPNFDTCISRPDDPNSTTKAPYTSVEASIDAWALAAYAGFDADNQNKANSAYVKGLAQTFYQEEPNNNSLFICPKHTNGDYTPATVRGQDALVGTQMSCELDQAMWKPGANPANDVSATVAGVVIVRRPARPAIAGVAAPDATYDGTAWQPNYIHETRNLAMVKYDTYNNAINMGPAGLPDTCPSTVGVGGSAFAPSFDKLDVPELYGTTSSALLKKITNLGLDGTPGLAKNSGSFVENGSLFSAAGAGYNPLVNFDRAVLANGTTSVLTASGPLDETLDIFGYQKYAGPAAGLLYDPEATTYTGTQKKNTQLYELSSYEFPFDGQARNASGSFQITIGRDPQVFEPGFGPLQNYLSRNPGQSFAVSPTLESWPCNPLPQEGFGSWWLRPALTTTGTVQTSFTVNGANTQNFGLSAFQATLGYGTLTFEPRLLGAQNWPSSRIMGLPLKAGQPTDLFMYDTSIATTSQKYQNGPWTAFLPFNGLKGGLEKFGTLDAKRSGRAQSSIQNAISLRLKNKPEVMKLQPSSNWKYLVALNFYRPRNWSFSGLVFDTEGLPLSQSIGNGVPQLILATDQPDAFGRYEFLVPDPYFAKTPVMNINNSNVVGTPIGLQVQAFTSGPDGPTINNPQYNSITSILQSPNGSLPASLTIVEGTPATSANGSVGVPGTMNWPTLYNAWHYWTINSSSSATLDLYINVTSILQGIDSADSFDWLESVNMPDIAWQPNLLEGLLDQYLYDKTAALGNACAALVAFNNDPKNYFVWTDPTAQTARSLKSMAQEGYQNTGFSISVPQCQAILMIGLTASGFTKRSSNTPTLPTSSDYSGIRHSLLRYTYKVSNVGQSTDSGISKMLSANTNAACLMGLDSNSGNSNSGSVMSYRPPADPRGFTALSNYQMPATAINISTSDYDVETDNSMLFAFGLAQVPQDLLAQNVEPYGDALYGFGLRIDSTAVVPERSFVSATTNGALPTDHGYVSMVRTIVDSHDRFVAKPLVSADPWPHVQRLTYITRYVPSNLKAYGTMVQMAPMRPLGPLGTSPSGTLQNLPNPFRPRKTYFVENCPYVNWARPTAGSFNYGTTTNGITTYSGNSFAWRAFPSNYVDFESPGYWGRQPLPLLMPFVADVSQSPTVQNNLANTFYDTSVQPNLSIMNEPLPIAGYEGFVDNSNAYITGKNLAPIISLRSIGNIDTSALYSYAVANDQLIAGKMLVDLLDAFTISGGDIDVSTPSPDGGTIKVPPDGSPCIRLEMSTATDSGSGYQMPVTFRKVSSIQSFMYTYVMPAYATYFGYAMSGSQVLVTHEEAAAIFSSAIGTWFTTVFTGPLSTVVVTVASTFDVGSDRPTFTFSWTHPTALTAVRFYVASPISNWLGLRPVVPPLIDMSSMDDTDQLVWRFQDVYLGGALGSIQSFYNTGGYSSNVMDANSFSWKKYIKQYFFFDGTSLVDNTYDLLWNSSYITFTEFQSLMTKMFITMGQGGGYHAHINFGYLSMNGSRFVNNFQLNNTNTDPFIQTKVFHGTDSNYLQSVFNWSNYQNWTWDAQDLNVGEFSTQSHTFSQPLFAPITEWSTQNSGWVTTFGATKIGLTDSEGWTTKGWSGFNSFQNDSRSGKISNAFLSQSNAKRGSPPMYSLFFDTNNLSTSRKSVVFKGQSGMSVSGDNAITHNLDVAGNYCVNMSDITNASWITRLATAVVSAKGPTIKCTHWWGLLGGPTLAGDLASTTTISTIDTFGAYHADASLVYSQDDGVHITGQTQYSGTSLQQFVQPRFMNTPQIPYAPIGSAETFVKNTCPYVDIAAVPAIEVPCPFGSAGSLNGPLLKPANYTSITDPLGFTGAPRADIVAADYSTNLLAWSCQTRQTLGSLWPSITAEGSIQNPFQLQTALQRTSMTPSQTTNQWQQPWNAPVPNTAVNISSGVTDANGLAMFMITQSCYINVGPTQQYYPEPANGANQRIALWIFNYAELFATSVQQPFMSGLNNSDPQSLRNGYSDLDVPMRPYLRGVPYYMDESYDNTTYSTLGRSFFISAKSLSSMGNPLDFDVLRPIVAILAPASPNDSFVGPNPITGPQAPNKILNTYSNAMAYSFTEPYNPQGPRVVYSVAFTDPTEGPMWTFYGLDNTTKASFASKASDISPPNSTATFSTSRKLYASLSKSGQYANYADLVADMNDESKGTANDCAVDIRQVYFQNSLQITAEPPKGLVDPYSAGFTWQSSAAPWALQQANNLWSFSVPTFENPSWATAPNIVSNWLPLAGTWPGDRNLDFLEAQRVPNYEGLSLMTEWASGPTSSTKEPTMLQWAVDRVAGNMGIPLDSKPSELPFDTLALESMRPNSLFVLLCDVWRNTIRNAVAVPAGSPLVLNLNLPIKIDYADCMAPGDYDSSNASLSTYYGMCNGFSTFGGLSSQNAVAQTGAPLWDSTPWIADGTTTQVWSPFTGGSFWNTFNTGGLGVKASDTRTAFSPNIWWPTYRWLLGDTDPNNVWPTSIASNDTLLKSSEYIFTCSDGTIRKLALPASGPGSKNSDQPWPVLDSTTINTFYNAGINDFGSEQVFSFVWPGRLYNLTWWASNWWCTADNCSIWTTAPLSDASSTPINDPAIVPGFVASVITFRPLSIDEGHPPQWANANWPTNEAHKFNCMRILQNGANSVLFIASIDGSYVVITESAGRFQAMGPNGDPDVWPYLPGPVVPVGPSGPLGPIMYVSDIAATESNLLLGSLPLPVDPQIDPTEFTSSIQEPIASLSWTSTGLPLLIEGQHNTWPQTLADANVVSILSVHPYGAQDLVSELSALTQTLTSDTIGTRRTSSVSWPPQIMRANGLSKIYGPDRPKVNDSALHFYPDTALPINATKISSAFGIATNRDALALGNTILGFQHDNDLQTQTFQSIKYPKVAMKLFHGGGLTFDSMTRAFFVLDDTSGSLALGLKAFVPANDGSIYQFIRNAPPYIDENAGTTSMSESPLQNLSIVKSGGSSANISPMWRNSIGYEISLAETNGALSATLAMPTKGPLYEIKDSLQNYAALNVYQSMTVKRVSSILENLTIADMAYAQSASAMAFTMYGPYGSQNLSVAAINTDGTLNVIDIDSTKDAFGYLQPQYNGPSIIAWNPYELKWYSAGIGIHTPDPNIALTTTSGSLSLTIEEFNLLKPSGIALEDWSATTWDPKDLKTEDLEGDPFGGLPASDQRLLILSADASAGAFITNTDGSLGPIHFTQVFKVVESKVVARQRQSTIAPLSRSFHAVTCFGFSQGVTAVCGSSPSDTVNLQNGGTWPNDVQGTLASLMWRTNVKPAGDDLKANWTTLNLGTPGYITAIKFVGYAWYITTWDPYANLDPASGLYEGQSTLYFASINFNALSTMDSWSPNVLTNVTSIEAAMPASSKCGPGFEGDPSNPALCVKVCPQGFTPFGTLCVQTCPGPYTETGVPNECQPDFITARTVEPTAHGQAPTTVPLKVVQSGTPSRSINWVSLISILIITSIFMLLIIGFLVKK